MDSTMFDVFNGHDVDRLMSMFTDGIEFYHDTGGLTDHRQTKGNFGKFFANTPDIRRGLVKGKPKQKIYGQTFRSSFIIRSPRLT